MKTATSPSNLHSRCGGRVAGFVALALTVLLGTAVASAQTLSPASHPSTPVASARPQAAAVPAHRVEEESEGKPNDASHQGIKIHGHWKIDIKNPDGSLASTHEFENSLADNGALFSYLLTGRATSGEAAVNLITTVNNLVTTTYLISETSTGYWATGTNCTSNTNYVCAPNLNVTVAFKLIDGGKVATNNQVVLAGSVVATSNSTIFEVQSAFAACNSATGLASVTPAQCHTGTVPPGTSVNNLPQEASFYQGVLTDMQPLSIAVLSGQTIQVTVTLSFS